MAADVMAIVCPAAARRVTYATDDDLIQVFSPSRQKAVWLVSFYDDVCDALPEEKGREEDCVKLEIALSNYSCCHFRATSAVCVCALTEILLVNIEARYIQTRKGQSQTTSIGGSKA